MKHNIIYVIPFAEDIRPPSIFQGFSSGILGIHPYIYKILNLPQNVFELFSTRENIVSARMSGYSGYAILPIDKRFINNISLSDDLQFLCIFSNEQTIQEVENFINENNQPVLHVSTQESETGILIDDFEIEHIYSYVEKVMDILPPGELHSILAQLEKRPRQWSKERISLKRRHHLVTAPNEMVLSSLDFEFEGDDHLLASTTDTPYIEAITRSAQVIIEKRSSSPLSKTMGISLILTSPSKSRNLYRMKVNAKTLTGLDASKSMVRVFRQIQRQTKFSLNVELDDLKESLSDSPVKYLLAELATEAKAYTIALAVKACNNFAPVLRLPPAVNTLHNDLISLGGCARGSSARQHFKINKIFQRIVKRLTSIIDPAYLKCIDQDYNNIKVICDAPLEWLPIRNLPLMLRFDTSRVPTTPGNLFFHMTIMNQQITLPLQAFEEILIIRSFREDDKIRDMLEQAVDIVQNRAKKEHKYADKNTELNIRIKWVDVSDEEEFVHALNEFSGAVMVFDGHGTHKKNADFGSLVVGDTELNVWELREQARIPPVVLLSACDTHPIDASHASVANGFLNAGALTVLATLLPIKAKESAIFIARLILRLEEYLPCVTKEGKHQIRWTSVVSGLQRMMFSTETLYLLLRKRKVSLSENAHFRVMSNTNMLINSEQPDWYEQMLELFAEEMVVPIDVLTKLIQEWGQIPESIKYIQVGNPELILIESNENIVDENVEQNNQSFS